MRYYIFKEEADCYRLVKSYKNWCGKPMMEWLHSQPLADNFWVVATRIETLRNFSSLGMPSTYRWSAIGWMETRMPVKRLEL